MGRRIRRVSADWVHPVYTAENTRYREHIGQPIPLFEGTDLDKEIAEWDEGFRKWSDGLRPEGYDANGDSLWITPGDKPLEYRGVDDTWQEWTGNRPDPKNYMPSWPEAERTHIAMYEDTTEGTPISPVFKTGVALAHWLADNDASCFGYNTASFETWLRWIQEDGVVDSEEDIAEEMAALNSVEDNDPAQDKPIWAR
ncbi:hypothetical protein G6L37_00275 [Agrobacterium rubi]|nr:hypothetical protein [Agrobacterium rubi]NTF23824.1 hypothetical protein [Agrobacterium rubi]